MQIIKDINTLQAVLLKLRNDRKTIGFVPTMGALHQGHLSLLEKSVALCDVSVVSIFINPTQFNDPNDFSAYPVTLAQDIHLLENNHCDFLFLPSVDEIYKGKYANLTCNVDFGSLITVLEGNSRPGHFQGVIQVVSILFSIVQPDMAFFGEKDFQQLSIIKFLVANYNFGVPIQIIPCKIEREVDGLAMSSRNARLTTPYRKIAPQIYSILQESLVLAKTTSVSALEAWVTQQIENKKEFKLEYFKIVNYLTLQEVSHWGNPDGIIGCIALFCGEIRLIDNVIYE